jgi:hypothetical protein
MNDYLDKLRPIFTHKTDAELELLCSASRELQRKTGLSAHEHRKRGMQKLFPSRVWHEWRDERVASVQECLEHRIQELLFLGSSNSNKSADMADLALTLWWTKPEMTSIYVTSPYETATETGLWAYILEQFDEAKDHNPSLPGKKKHSDNSIVLYDRNPRSFIRVATVDQVGKLVGKKARDFSQGLLIILADELPAFTQVASKNFVSVMANLWSVPNLLVIGAGNFASVYDALGVLADPAEDSIPGGYDGFDADRHFRWKTKRNGLALRFDGLQSPNVKAGYDIYPFVTTNAYIAKLAAAPGGLQSADAMRYVRSAPVTSLDEFTVTNTERIRAGGCYQPIIWTSDPIKKGAFCDPGFGGDPCILQFFKLGWAMIGTERRQIVALDGPPEEIPVRIGMKDDLGEIVTPERQIVAECKKRCQSKGVLPQEFGFDGSMRSGIVQAFVVHWSTLVQPIDSGGRPTERKVNANTETTWREAVDRFVTELWFSIASLIDSMQIRGLEHSKKTVEQLCNRRWRWAGKKKQVEPKVSSEEDAKRQGWGYKSHSNGESPNEADAFVGCVEMARRMGLVLNGIVVSGGSLELIRKMNEERESVKMLASLTRNGLPSGVLHATKRGNNSERGNKLHR